MPFLFSMGNKAYAFDINTASNIWTTSLGRPFLPDPYDPVDFHHINPSFGVLSTPVVDRDAARLPAPVGPKPCSMPSQDRVRLNNVRQIEQAWPEAKSSIPTMLGHSHEAADGAVHASGQY